MDLNELRKHPAFDGVTNQHTRTLVHFKTGRVERVPDKVQAAFIALCEAVQVGHAHSLQLLREWEGGVTLEPPKSRAHNPPITKQQIRDFHAVVERAAPGHRKLAEWPHASHGIEGYTLAIVEKKP